MNKRGFGIEFEWIKLLFYAFMVILVAFVIILGYSLSFNNEIDITNLEKSISEHRLFSSPHCFGYFDDDRFFVRGIINLSRFNEDSLSGCLGYPDGRIQGMKLSLVDFEGNLIREVELNKKVVSQRLICAAKGSVIRGYHCYADRKYVLYNEGDDIKQGFLNYVVVGEID